MLATVPEGVVGAEDESRGVETTTFFERTVEHPADLLFVKVLDSQKSGLGLDQIPRLRTAEETEEHYAKKQILCAEVVPGVGHSNQRLADSITSPEDVAEPILPKNLVPRPRRCPTFKSSLENQ